ncbi:endoribonuclease Dicer homolog 3 [Humulus lupulus]|uniref:endoribonuclease Dicer homolog 3 n=1 Tax=Humulus lupulus TaxID=3486 RepID=UPI002B417309|nr:endoribonuclease Dicer homolog 3 [Humulus lupulus]
MESPDQTQNQKIPNNDKDSLIGCDHALQLNSHGDGGPKPFNPRRYQLEVYEVAINKNTIAVMETGAGKTLIAVMLIHNIGQTIKSTQVKKIIIFLAPTVHLVNQQFEVIKSHTGFEVGEYYGGKGVDEWTEQVWQNEINQHDVLVMTPQVLLDALRRAFFSLESVGLMVIDECHRAIGNHPYTKIMKEFYHKCRRKPKIFGMTASPVVRKGVSSTTDCEGQLSELESILDSQIYTVEDKAEMEIFVPSAKETLKFYDPNRYPFLDLKAKIEALWLKSDASFSNWLESVQSNYKDMDDRIKTLRKRLSNDHGKISYCLDELGLVCAYEAAKVCLENFPNTQEDCKVHRESLMEYKSFLEEVLCAFEESFTHGCEDFMGPEFDYVKAVHLGYVSSKIQELIELFQSFGGAMELLCLIFVNRIIIAKVIERFVKKVACLSHFTVSYLTGSNTSSVDALAPKLQKETLDSFRSGKVNLLFATDVVEEGIHVPNCSYVIRFDLPKTVRSYVQSRGRARQLDSQFVMMLERGNAKQRDQLYEVIRSERSVIDTATNRDPNMCIVKPCASEVAPAYHVDATGASITADSSVSLIHRYCERLPGDKYFTPKPTFKCSYVGQRLFECRIMLPPNAAFKTLVGPVSKNSHLSKQLVCLEACKKLHQLGALDDHLLPSTEESSEKSVAVKSKEAASGAGTTKRKELHGTTCARALSGTWEEKHDAVFHAYRFVFACSNVGEFFSEFVLLIETKLDDDVGNFELELFLVSKTVKSSVSYCGQVNLDAEQMKKAKCFQELFFNGLFGKLFIGSKSSGTKRELLLHYDEKRLWNQFYSYLLLPLDSLNETSNESWRISWQEMDSCISVVELLKKNSLSGAQHCNGENGNVSPCKTEPLESISDNIVRFANGSVDTSNLEERVVLAIHTGKLYSIVDLESSTSAESPFEVNGDDVPSPFTSYTEYFNKKYGIVLKYPNQPLLRLKQSHNPHNLLVNFSDEGATGKTSKNGLSKPQMHAHMPPELLMTIDIPRSVIKSLYLIPSLMHRLESLMLASQLRKEIDFQLSDASSQISSSLILEALTTLRCCENFSMERLELLGDSVLKYVVGCHRFLKYPKKHEGQLTSRRSSIICNSNLHKLGTDHKLQGYIRDSAFDPRRWVAPGQHSLRPVPCKCGLDTLEVPLDRKFQTEDPKIVVGKSCDKGHRWMGSKTIADCVEALIGAYYVGGGLTAAIHMMKWFGIDAELEPSLVLEAISIASLRFYTPKGDEIATLESKIKYVFSTKGLLQEAITHASDQELNLDYCYQRLEFLGDSVLDLLTTRYLYETYTDIDPGELTDLRSACVSNENFAQAAVRRDLQPHLQHCSGLLQSQIAEYAKSFGEHNNSSKSFEGAKGPKALGDMFESIAGAVLIDTKLNIDEVWRIFEPLLSPIVTPDKLELPPLRELNELCDSLGHFIKENCTKKGEMVHAELTLQLKDVRLIGEGSDRSKKAAKGEAARQLLKKLETRGISYSWFSKKRKQGTENVDNLFSSNMNTDENGQTIDDEPAEAHNHKKLKTDGPIDFVKSNDEVMGNVADYSEKKGCSSNHDTPVISIKMNKGGPRMTLFELCKKQQWQMPEFKSRETKSRTPIELGEGSEKRTGFNSYVSDIVLYIPNSGDIGCTGDARADKKSSLDSAALVMLYELEQQGKLIIGNKS